MNWKFQDPQNLAVITSRSIIESNDWIARVTRDQDDGGWQFDTEKQLNVEDAALVSLRQIVELDGSVEDLHDLPQGWRAWRKSRNAPWQRSEAV